MSLVLAGCGAPAAISVHNVVDATTAPLFTQGTEQTPMAVTMSIPVASNAPTLGMSMDNTPGVAASATSNKPGATAVAPATQEAKPAASSTDYVLIWNLFGTPTATPAKQQTAVKLPGTPETATSGATTIAVTTLAATTTRLVTTATPSTPTGQAKAPSAANSLPGDPGRGKVIFTTTGGCTACHDVTSGTTLVGPSLKGIASRAASRKPGMSADDYLHESILSPNAYVVPGFQPGIMLQNLGQVLTPQQISDVIAYLMTLK